MAIESRCESCGKRLRVAEEYAARQARCPECGHVYRVPEASTVDEAEPAADSQTLESRPAGDAASTPLPQASSPTDEWYMKTPEGQIYGPTTQRQLHTWVSEGRVTDDCQLRRGERGDWNQAGEVFPQLRQSQSFQPGGGTYASGYPASSRAQPYRTSGYGTGRHVQPHRGGIILTFAILGWAFCPIFSVVAWTMGTTDLNQMRRGLMDNSGMGVTQAGQVLGMINTIIAGGVIVLAFLFMICAAAAEGM